MSNKYVLKLPCMKCGMVGRHLNTPHWKCPELKKKDGNSNSRDDMK